MARKNQHRGTAAAMRLPNAPLTEVVFELRWRLKGDDFKIDPGYYMLLDQFEAAAHRLGFSHSKSMSNGLLVNGHSVDRRFYIGEGQNFPLLQLGPGIYAANESVGYRWDTYKELCLAGAKAVLASYPPIKSAPFTPIYLELRYIDSFNAKLVPEQNVVKFLNSHTSLRVEVPEYLAGSLGPISAGQVTLNFPVKDIPDTTFIAVVSNGFAEQIPTVILNSKVVTRAETLKIGSDVAAGTKRLEEWLDRAHAITSPFFKEFVSKGLMARFEGAGDA